MHGSMPRATRRRWICSSTSRSYTTGSGCIRHWEIWAPQSSKRPIGRTTKAIRRRRRRRQWNRGRFGFMVMVVLELLSSRGSLACPAAGGSRGGRRRHFLPLLDSMWASTDALDTRSFLPQPSPRATSAYVVPDFLYGSTAFCLNSAVYLGDGVPIVPPFPAFGHHAETEIRLSTDLGQIQIQIQCGGQGMGRDARETGLRGDLRGGVPRLEARVRRKVDFGG